MAAPSFTAARISADPTKGALIDNYQTAEAIALGQWVYINSSGYAALADASAEATSDVVGIAVAYAGDQYGNTTVASGDRVSVCKFGKVYGFASLTPGARLYLSDTAGAADTAEGTVDMPLGFCDSATAFFVDIGRVTPAS